MTAEAPTDVAGTTVVGVLADPGVPAELAHRLAEELPGLLGDRPGCDHGWDVRVEVQRLPSPSPGHRRLLGAVRPQMRAARWDLTVCLVDFPLRDGAAPLAADLLRSDGVVVVSVPAFGGLSSHRRVRAVVAELIAATGAGAAREERADPDATPPADPFRRVVPDAGPVEDPVDLRLLAAPGRLRLLAGMVRANRPWRLVFSLTGALAAALATGAYVVCTASVWQLADLLGPTKLLITMIFAMVAMVTWLILSHHLWERPSDVTTREDAQLFNTSTVLSLSLEVGFLYAALFVVIALAASFLIDAGLLGGSVGHPVGVRDYLHITWFATSLALVAGALGTGFESEDDVRKVAYRFRERARRRDVDGRGAADGSGDRR